MKCWNTGCMGDTEDFRKSMQVLKSILFGIIKNVTKNGVKMYI